MSAKYDLYTVDLGTANTKLTVVSPRTRIVSVTVLRMASGAALKLQFGGGGRPLPVVQGRQFFNRQGCVIEDDGLYGVVDTAQSGVTVDLYVGLQ